MEKSDVSLLSPIIESWGGGNESNQKDWYFHSIMKIIDDTEENQLAIMLDKEIQEICKKIYTCSDVDILLEVTRKIYSLKVLRMLLIREKNFWAVWENEDESKVVLEQYIDFVKMFVRNISTGQWQYLTMKQKADIKDALIQNVWALSKINFFEDKVWEGTSVNLQVPELQDKSFLIVNNRHDSSYTIAHFIRQMWAQVQIIDNQEFQVEKVWSNSIVVLWPGEWDINNEDDNGMQKLLRDTQELRNRNIKTFGICLWFQAIAKTLWYSIEKQEKSVIGGQIELVINNSWEKVGVYNYYSAVRASSDISWAKIIEKEWRLYGMQTLNTSWVQFHPESLMSTGGFNILKQQLIELIVGNM